MRARLQKIPGSLASSFRVLEIDLARFDAPWHFHAELELTWIVSSHGQRHVGDHLERFVSGDLCLLGPNLPHFWQSGRLRRGERARAVVVQFGEEFVGVPFLACPEVAPLRRLFAQSRRGVHFPRSVVARLESTLQALSRQRGLQRLLALLGVLATLAESRGARPLASPNFEPLLDRRAESRLERAMGLVRQRFADTLTLPEVARAAAMSPEGFCRYFKRAAGRNFSTYLNEVRTGHAAQMLVETNYTVARIAQESGYASLSNFNRRFREFKRLNPVHYRHKFRHEEPPPPSGRTLGHEFSEIEQRS